MTIHKLMSSLITELEVLLKDISFVGVNGEEKKIKGYVQEIPLRNAAMGWEEEPVNTEEALFPYFVVQMDTIEFREDGAEAKIFILFALYDSSKEMRGWENITNVVERVVCRFRENVVLESYYCGKEMTVAYPEKGEWPYFFAGLEMNWNLPNVEEMQCEEN